MMFDEFVRVVACVGIVTGGGFLVWFGAAKGAQTRCRRETERAAVAARLDAAMPLSEHEHTGLAPEVEAVHVELLQLQAEMLRRTMVDDVPASGSVVVGQVEHARPDTVCRPLPLSAGERSAFEDPPKALPRGRDDRGESAWGVVAGVAAILLAWSFLSGYSIKALIDDGIDLGGAAFAAVRNGEVPPAPWADDAGSSDGKTRGPVSGGAGLRVALGRVEVVEARPDVPGYMREAFGPDWTDDTEAPAGGNGCDTRNDVLARDLTGVRYEDDDRCVVAAGKLADPYTGRTIRFDRDDATAVQVDHIVPLSAAWDLGAAEWSPQRREVFANDVRRNLLASDGPTNMAKGDQTPAQWLPPDHAAWCTYLARYLAVVDHYDLAVTAADAAVVEDQAPRCGRGRDHGGDH